MLVDARDAYAASTQGLAGKLTPTELYDAKKVLDKADREFEDRGDTVACRDLAYVAQRKVELADVKARTEQDRQSIAAAVKAGVVVRDDQARSSQAALVVHPRPAEHRAPRQRRLDQRAARRATTPRARSSTTTNAQLESEKKARASVEAKLAGAMKDLATIAAVKEEARGVVITLSGSVLFASGKYALLNTAMTKLDQVAEALKAQDADKRMVVEGHTDSQGSDATNQPLSLNRATAVRDYLVSTRRRLRSDLRGGPGLDPGHHRQQDAREPRQQPPGGDHHRRRERQRPLIATHAHFTRPGRFERSGLFRWGGVPSI